MKDKKHSPLAGLFALLYLIVFLAMIGIVTIGVTAVIGWMFR